MFLSHEKRAMLQENIGMGVFALSIEHSTGTLRFCSGNRSIQYDSEWFDPRGMSLPELSLETAGSSARISLADTPDDADSLERLHYSSRFSGGLMWWHFLRWSTTGAGWVELFSYAWTITQCTKTEREAAFDFILSGATGTNPRAGLEIIGRGCGLGYGGTLCGGTIGTYKNCDGSTIDCVLRGREESYRGAILAPEPDHEIEFFSRESPYTIGSNHYTPPPPPGGESSGSGGSDSPIAMTIHEQNTGDGRNPSGGRSGGRVTTNIVDDFIQSTPAEEN